MPRKSWPASALNFRSLFSRSSRADGHHRRKSTLQGQESLEPRVMLAAAPVLNEFMAINTRTIQDADGDYSDWLELKNAGDMAADLSGFYLTDDPGDPDKWQIPAGTNLAADNYLVVFASGKNRAIAGSQLHTNFTLHGGGAASYLALVAPNGTTVVDSFSNYPVLTTDQSYGRIRRSVATNFADRGSAAQTLVPSAGDNTLIGNNWKNAGFVPGAAGETAWTAGPISVGYETAVTAAGFLVQYYKAPGANQLNNLAAADALIAAGSVTASRTDATVNILGSAGNGRYGDDRTIPGVTAGTNVEDYALRATGTIFVRPDQAGLWTFGINADDGTRVRIDGVIVINDDVLAAPHDFFGRTTLTAGTHTLELVFFERGGGDEVELFAAQGDHREFDSDFFRLVGDSAAGGLATGGLDQIINTDIQTQMAGVNSSAYTRVPFNVADASAVQTLKLDASYDDGAVYYLNGTEILRRNAPAGTPAFNAAAAANSGLASSFNVDLGAFRSALVNGNNVLAIHGLNASAGDGDFYQSAKLYGRRLLPETIESFGTATPGGANGALQPVISEFLADNGGVISDEDADTPDYIEIFNPGQLSIDLTGYYLTNDSMDLDKWAFPAVTLEPSDHLLLFASEKDRRNPTARLHTNFTIAATNTYLALVKPDGVTKVSEFANIPDQRENVSYGFEASTVQTTILNENVPGAYLVPTAVNPANDSWRTAGYDTTGWITGNTGVGFELGTGYQNVYRTNVGPTMRPTSGAGNTSLYMRVPFNVADPNSIKSLILQMQYDDGFVAYINGVEVASANKPAVLAFNSATINAATHDDAQAVLYQDFDITNFLSAIVPGDNILAIHGLDAALTSSDFLITPKLIGTGETTLSPNRRYFFTPTPGTPNGLGVLGFVGDTRILKDHGFYNAPISVHINNNSPGLTGVQIYYTTNGDDPRFRFADGTYGSDPGPTAQLYTGPITVGGTTVVRAAGFKTGFQPSRIDSRSYMYLDDIVTQSLNDQAPPGWPATWGANTVNYGMDDEVIGPNPTPGNETYAATIKQNLQEIPTWSIVMDLDDMLDPSRGFYSNPGNDGRSWERQASCEVIDPLGLESGFQANCGIRVRGGFSRSTGNPKHALRLFFRGEYGDSELNYPLFGDAGADRYDKIDLRTSQNYSWAFQNDAANNTFSREMWSRHLQRDLGQPYTRGKFYHVYINGIYWGLYDSQERGEANFGETYLGGENESYDTLHADSQAHFTEVTDGNFIDWTRFLCGAQDIGGTFVATRAPECGVAPTIVDAADRYARYMKLQGLNPDGTRNPAYHVDLDADNLIVYMMAIIYAGNADAPVSNFLGNSAVNNWFGTRQCSSPQVGRVCEGERGWTFFAHDNEHTLGTHGLTFDRTGPWPAASLDLLNQSNPQSIFEYLWMVPEFKLRVADIAHKAFFNNGVLTPANNVQRFLDIAHQIGTWTTNPAGTTVTSATGAIVGESARWGDGSTNNSINPPATAVNWAQAVVNVVNSFFPTRSDIVLNQLRGDGLYPNTTAASFSPQFGGMIDPGFQLSMNAPAGRIYYTTDGSDPRLVGGSINPNATAYNSLGAGIGPNAATQWLIPTGAPAETGWQNRTFTPTGWNNGTTAIGYDTNVTETGPGFQLRVVDTSAGPSIPDINTAVDLLIDGQAAGYTIASDTMHVVPYVDLGDAGNLNNPPTLAVPGTSDREQYAIRASATVTIPVGTWSISVGSDDGFRLTIPGVTFTSRANADAGTAANVLQFSAPRGHAQTSGVFTVTGAPLVANLLLDFYEAGGGDSVEMSIFSGNSGFNAGTFQTLRDGILGWTVTATSPQVDFDPLISTDIQTAMQNVNSSAYLRIPFTVTNAANVNSLLMNVNYEDGFVAYVNGTEVARRNAPGTAGTPLAFNAISAARRDDNAAIVAETIDISAFRNALVEGSGNVLAVQLLNLTANDADALFDVRMDHTYVANPVTLNGSTRVNARVLNTNGEWSAMTTADYLVAPPALRVTELNYNPGDPTQAEIDAFFTDNDDFEFLEIQNTGASTLNLGGVTIDQGVTYTFANTENLAPGERIAVVRDVAAFQMRYGNALRAVGPYTGTLSNNGESIRLVTGLGQQIQEFTYADGWYPLTDGLGYTLISANPGGPLGDWSLPAGWRTSYLRGGSPAGAEAGTSPDPTEVTITEVTPYTNDAAGYAIEIHNTSGAPLNISRWYVSDDVLDVTKYQLPAGLATIPDGGYFTLRRVTHNLPADLLKVPGGTLVLHASDGATTPTGFETSITYTGGDLNVSQGPYLNADGNSDVVPFVSRTLGSTNAAPKVGPVVINEIMYNPAFSPTADEFIELYNISGAAVSLANWSFQNGITFTFPNVTIPAGGYLLVAPTDGATFRTRHPNVPASVQIVGPYLGVLDNGGEPLGIYRPGDQLQNILVDRVDYNDEAPWVVLPDGTGPSLSRVTPGNYGNESVNWRTGVAGGTPGSTNTFFDETPPSTPTNVQVSAAEGPAVTVTWNPSIDAESGVAAYSIFRNGVLIGTSTSNSFTSTAPLDQVLTYTVSAVNGDGIAGAISAGATIHLMGLTNVTKFDATTLELTFSQNVAAATGNNPANYFVSNGVTVTAAVVQATATRVRLTVTGYNDAQPVRVVVNGVTGTSGAIVAPNANRTLNTGTGVGLLGTIWDYATTGTIPVLPLPGVTRTGIANPLNFTWITAPTNPFTGFTSTDTYAARFEGRILPPTTDAYTLSLTGNDGIRLWIDADNDGLFEDIPSERLIDRWTIVTPASTIPAAVAAPAINFVAGQKYGIRVDVFDDTNLARILLEWQAASINSGVKQTVPGANLEFGTAESIAPTMTAITADSTDWSAGFRSSVTTAGLGTGVVNVPVGGSSPVIPWNNVNRVSIRFSEDVNLTQSSLVLTGDAGPLATNGFSYNYQTYTGTWTLAQPAPFGRISVTLPGVRDILGNNLSTPGTATYIRSNPGDVDVDGDVDQTDFRANLDKQFLSSGNAGYSIFHDVDASGAINIRDWQLVRQNLGHTLPPASPAAAPGAQFENVSTSVSQESSTQGKPVRVMLASSRPRLGGTAVDRALADDARPAATTLRARRTRVVPPANDAAISQL